MTSSQMGDKAKLSGENEKIKRRRYKVGDDDFKPPDGGWGWIIIIACGASNLVTVPMFQQFGLVFRERFAHLGITTAETTMVTNLQFAFNSCVGLLNGPMFKVFSYRQVGFAGSCLVVISLIVTTYCSSLWMYILFYGVCYGSGIGINQSALALALNTYFKKKRRIATGLSWSITALGPIGWPYIITSLTDTYDTPGTILIFAGLSTHAIFFSQLLHPVEWHTPFRDIEVSSPSEQAEDESQLDHKKFPKKKMTSSKSGLFSSQYMFNEDDRNYTGYEIIDPGTPMMIKANDGWFSQNVTPHGSRGSLHSGKASRSQSVLPSGQNSVGLSTRPSYSNIAEAKVRKTSMSTFMEKEIFRPHNNTSEGKSRKLSSGNNIERDLKDRSKKQLSQNNLVIEEELEDFSNGDNMEAEAHNTLLAPKNNTNERMVLQNAAEKLAEYKIVQAIKKRDSSVKFTELDDVQENNEVEEDLTFLQKVYIFFDFDLLKDPVYVNLMLGITVANFVEINFSILTPMVLTEFNFEKMQIATFMSLLGATDICVRFFVPFLAGKIGWDNSTFFLVGVLAMALGRVILVHTQTYPVSLAVAVLVGAGKGLRTIFMALVIPSHVPLEKLPAASGLQLATSGIFFLALGPFVGWIRDYFDNYVITLHLLNIFTYSTAIAWTIEKFINKRSRKDENV